MTAPVHNNLCSTDNSAVLHKNCMYHCIIPLSLVNATKKDVLRRKNINWY